MHQARFGVHFDPGARGWFCNDSDYFSYKAELFLALNF